MNEIEEIKGRVDLVDLISQYVTLKKAGANYKGSCPFHQEKTASFMVSPQKQIWKCFGCGRGGDHYKFVMEAEHLEFGDALKMLAQKAGVTLQPRTNAEHQTQNRKEGLYRINELASQIFHKVLLDHPDGKEALKYLEKRHLTKDTIKKFRLGYASKRVSTRELMLKKGAMASEIERAGRPDKFFERIIFPIFDVLGHVIAFTGRSLGEAQPKYLNSPENPLYAKSRTLYGLNFARLGIKEKDYVILVEGQMDVISLHQADATQAVASSGTAITEAQIQILSKYTQNFLLAFDNDLAGKTTTKKVIEMLLKLDLNGKVVDFGSYKDAGELFEQSPKEWPAVVKAAKEMVDWLIDQEIELAGDLQFVENKKKVMKAVIPTLILVNDPTRLDHYATRLASALGSKPESVYAALDKVVKTPGVTSPSKVEVPKYLTNEEQLLAMVINQPQLLNNFYEQFDQIVWSSADAHQIAGEVKKCYTDKALVKDQTRFTSQVKNHLDSRLAEKIDSWQFWLTSQWADFSTELATELIGEKLGQLTTKKYEEQKESLASDIRSAQEKGDVQMVKKLMKELSELTRDVSR